MLTSVLISSCVGQAELRLEPDAFAIAFLVSQTEGRLAVSRYRVGDPIAAEEARLVGWTEEQLVEISPLVDLSGPATLTDPNSAECEHGRVFNDRKRIGFRAPPSGTVLTLPSGARTSVADHEDLRGLDLELPASEQRCSDLMLEFEWLGGASIFAQSNDPLDAASRVVDLRALPDRRLLLLTVSAIHLLEPDEHGVQLRKDAGHYFSAQRVPFQREAADHAHFENVAIDPLGNRVVTLVQQHITVSGEPMFVLKASAIVALRLDASGFVGSATTSFMPQVDIEDLAVSVEGRWAAVARSGEAFMESTTGFARYQPSPSGLSRIFATSDASRPFLISDEDGRLFVGDPIDPKTWERPVHSGSPRRAFDALTSFGGQYFGASEDGSIHTGDLTSWRRLAPAEVLPDPLLCPLVMDPACGRPEFGDDLQDMTAFTHDGETLLLVQADECRAPVVFRPRDRCAVLGRVPELPHSAELLSVEARGDDVLVGGAPGVLLELVR
ncbi:MAG: hypothetical protein HY791_08445 [Deltaproteobacteria bacterium]|nr:hypothetical protein [Deltaproteobacteria bacterium]